MALLAHLRAQGFEAPQVDIDGPLADGAAAGQGHLALPQPGAQRPQHQNGRPQALHSLGLSRLTQIAGGDPHVPSLPLHPGAAGRQHVRHAAHVGQIRRIMQHHGRLAQKRPRHDGQHGVLGRIDLRFPMQHGRGMNQIGGHGRNTSKASSAKADSLIVLRLFFRIPRKIVRFRAASRIKAAYRPEVCRFSRPGWHLFTLAKYRLLCYNETRINILV